jgi:hypothetical protein
LFVAFIRYFFIALLLFVGAVAIIPRLREQVLPVVQSMLDSRRSDEANTRIEEISALMVRRVHEVPPPAQFKAFVDKGLPNYRNAGTDPWGTPYYLRRDKFNAWVGSAGPDKIQGTDDDILSNSVPLQDNRYRGRRGS